MLLKSIKINEKNKIKLNYNKIFNKNSYFKIFVRNFDEVGGKINLKYVQVLLFFLLSS